LLGESLDLISLEADDEDEDITERLNGSAEQTKLLKRHMLAEAKSFRDLELLVVVLDSLELASNSVDAMRKYFPLLLGRPRVCIHLLTYLKGASATILEMIAALICIRHYSRLEQTSWLFCKIGYSLAREVILQLL
jgi:hypothetical protein